MAGAVRRAHSALSGESKGAVHILSILSILVTTAALLSGCGGTARVPAYLAAAPAVAGEAHTLRYRRTPGEVDRYRATYRLRVRNGLEQDEDVTARLSVYSTGKTPGPEVFDRVVFRRDEETRSFIEVAPNGRVTRKSRARQGLQPAITPNIHPEPGTSIYSIPFDDLGRIARRKATPYHYAWYDSLRYDGLCHMLPVFPRAPVRLGDVWEYEFPVIVGRTFSNNVTPLRARFRLAGLKASPGGEGGEGSACAVIDYTYHAFLDTDYPDDAQKMPDSAPGLLWRRNVVEGEGRAFFDVERGKILWKRDRYKVVLEDRTARPKDKPKDESKDGKKDRKGRKKGKKDDWPAFDVLRGRPRKSPEPGVDSHRSESKVEFTVRLLSPGEKASDKPSRTD